MRRVKAKAARADDASVVGVVAVVAVAMADRTARWMPKVATLLTRRVRAHPSTVMPPHPRREPRTRRIRRVTLMQ